MNKVIDKVKSLQRELNYIKDERLRNSASKLIELIPDYFFTCAASSTGKYHPSFSLGEGGLLRHTKVAVKIAKVLLENPTFGDKYTGAEKDLMIIGIIFHDSIKHGMEESKYTLADHPLQACKFIKDNKNVTEFTDEEIEFITSVIASHMGPWNTDYFTKEEILPKPKNKYQSFVHMCDYLSSKKFLNVNFVNGEIEE